MTPNLPFGALRATQRATDPPPLDTSGSCAVINVKWPAYARFVAGLLFTLCLLACMHACMYWIRSFVPCPRPFGLRAADPQRALTGRLPRRVSTPPSSSLSAAHTAVATGFGRASPRFSTPPPPMVPLALRWWSVLSSSLSTRLATRNAAAGATATTPVMV